MANVLAKVKGLVPERQRREIELRAGRLTIDMTPWVGNTGQTDAIEIIQQAMEQSRLIQFDYTDRQGQKSSRTVEPYRLLLKGMRWYVDAYCLERQDFRLFKLSRMTGLAMLDTPFAGQDYHPAPTVQPAFRDENIIMATLRVRAGAIERLEDVFGFEVMPGAEDEWMTAEIPISDDERGYRFLLGLGADCICVAPDSLRHRIKILLERMISPISKCKMTGYKKFPETNTGSRELFVVMERISAC